MNFQKTLLSLYLLLCAMWLSAGPVTPERAERIARTVLGSAQHTQSYTGKIEPISGIILLQTVYTTDLRDSDQPVAYYIFGDADHTGFVIVSGDDRMYPVLAYSLTETIDVANMPEPAREWLEYYRTQARQLTPEFELVTRGTDEPTVDMGSIVVSPLLARENIQWGQAAPFWNKAPLVEHSSTSELQHCPAGCVATAASQIMRFYKWPKRGRGSHSYFDEGSGQTLSANFDFAYDWDNMPGKASVAHGSEISATTNEVQSDAIATLLQHVGISVNMSYSSSGSGAHSFLVGQAMRRYFFYSDSMYFYHRGFFTAEEWYKMIKEELDNGRPVYHSGSSRGGGHAFVCDGYTSEDFFHFNWGWDGVANGFYKLEGLNPSETGIGAQYGAYNEQQMIFKHFVPHSQEHPGKEPRPLIGCSLEYEYDETSKKLDMGLFLFQENLYELYGDVTVQIINKDTDEIVLNQELGRKEIFYPDGFTNIRIGAILDLSRLSQGVYYTKSLVKLDNDAEPLVTLPFQDYIYDLRITVNADGTISIAPNLAPASLTYVAGSLKSNLTSYADGFLDLTVRNDGDRGFYGEIKLMSDDETQGDLGYLGGGFVFVPAGAEKAVRVNVLNFSLAPGSYPLSLYYQSRRPEDPEIYSPNTDKLLDLGAEANIPVVRAEQYTDPTYVNTVAEEQIVIDLSTVTTDEIELMPFKIANLGPDGSLEYYLTLLSQSFKIVRSSPKLSVSIPSQREVEVTPKFTAKGLKKGTYQVFFTSNKEETRLYGTRSYIVELKGTLPSGLDTPEESETIVVRRTTELIDLHLSANVAEVCLIATDGTPIASRHGHTEVTLPAIDSPMILILRDHRGQLCGTVKVL